MDLTKYRQKLIGSEDERAVSPVIGVILMVAITVILAAVIAAFVLDMGSGMGSSAQAGVSVDGTESSQKTVTVESLSGADGVAIVDSNGNLAGTDNTIYASDTENDDLRSVGASESFSADEVTDGDEETFSVVAYNGDSASERGDTNTVATFTLVGQP